MNVSLSLSISECEGSVDHHVDRHTKCVIIVITAYVIQFFGYFIDPLQSSCPYPKLLMLRVLRCPEPALNTALQPYPLRYVMSMYKVINGPILHTFAIMVLTDASPEACPDT